MWYDDPSYGGFRPWAGSLQLPPDHLFHPMAKKLRAYRSPSELPWRRVVKGLLGRILMPLMPAHAAAIKEDPFGRPLGAAGKLIRNGYFLQAVARRDHSLITRFLRNYWSSAISDEFYDGFSHRYETLFLAHHAGIVRETLKAVGRCGVPFRRIVEIGCGDGRILRHFAGEIPSIPECHGIDVNLPQIGNNRRVHADRPALAFHHADAAEWLRNHPQPGTVLVTNGGVLEYFTRGEVRELFAFLARTCRPCVVSLTESIAADHDLVHEQDTYPYGLELSLSHNYATLLHEAGFAIVHTHDRFTTPEESEIIGRWLQLVAVIS